jgi:hypothetical protein
LIRIAREKSIRGFTADVLAQNKTMLQVFSKAGYLLKTHMESGVYELEIDFSSEAQ